MYPGYKPREVMQEYAITFFSMLNEGYRQRYRHYLMMAQIADLPHMEDRDRKEFYRSLHWAASDPSAILKTSGEGSSPADIKKMLQG